MTTTDLDTPARALAIGAHPDDIEFGCGGTLAKWALQGCEIFHLVLTDGSKGSWDAASDAAALVQCRHEEQRAAQRALGGHGGVTFLDWPDGELEAGLYQRLQVAACIRRCAPDVVLGHDPWKRYRIHPDHRNAGWLTTDGVVAARDPLFFPELGLPPHRPRTILLFEADDADHLEDISATFDTKLAALLCHRSQLRSTMGIDAATGSPRYEEQLGAFEARLRQEAVDAAGTSGILLAESFKRIDDR
ncbi:MAG TPA: PIG-L family deacetylase [Acidimicrobiales bacterium]|nr:PIG-L family deacetylase [Acidimicrobiales bacterium]